jgi:hypothetical protein
MTQAAEGRDARETATARFMGLSTLPRYLYLELVLTADCMGMDPLEEGNQLSALSYQLFVSG